MMPYARIALLAFPLIVARAAAAQDVLPDATASPGTIRSTERELGALDRSGAPAWVTTAEWQEAVAGATRLAELFRRDKALNPLLGYNLTLSRGVSFGMPFVKGRQPIGFGIGGRVFPLFADSARHAVRQGEGSGWGIDANDWHCPYDQQVTEDSVSPVFVAPRVIGTVHGFAQYASGCIVVTKSARPLWVPVTRERWMKIQIADARKRLEEGNKTAVEMREGLKRLAAMGQAVPPETRKMMQTMLDSVEAPVRRLERELAAMPPEARRAPAVIAPTLELLPPGTDPASVPGAQALVAPNPEFWDHALPISAAQLIAVELWKDPNGQWYRPQDGAMYERLREGLDWDALVGMVQR